MKIKLNDTTPIQINWLVATCEGWEPGKYMMSPDIRKDVNGKVVGIMVPSNREYVWFKPSADWSHGGPIIEREKIELKYLGYDNPPYWGALKFSPSKYERKAAIGPTPLIAAMRCFVASRLGDEVEVPDELT